MMTSVVRSDETFSCQKGISGPFASETHPISAIQRMRSSLRDMSDEDLAILEDELDFFTFTGIADNFVKKLLLAI